MFTHYLKSAIKNLKKSGKVTLFNLIGLSVSFAAFLLLSIYIYDELSYDRYNENFEDIYRLNITLERDGKTDSGHFLPNPLADIIGENIPEALAYCSFAWGPGVYSMPDDPSKSFDLSTRAVDSTFTDIFTLKIKSGAAQPLTGQKRLIISERAAERIFGDEDPVGKTLLANFSEPYLIDAVYYNMPENSSIKYEAYSTYPTGDWVNDWSEYSFNHYYRFSENVDLEAVNQKIKSIPALQEQFEESENFKITYGFTPLGDVHFFPQFGSGNMVFVKTLILVALLLLVMAFVNYVNFAVANAPKLIKSANMRRVVGESKKRLILLSSLESILIISLSFIIGLLFLTLILQLWPDILGYEITFLNYSHIMLYSYFLFVVLGILFSLYPARLIVNVKPALALKGVMAFSAKNGTSGKVLTVIQYTISMMLIIGVLFIERQVSFLKNYDLGFEKENVLVLGTTPDIQKQEEAFAAELLKNVNISDYAYSQFVPGGVGMGWGRDIEGKNVSFKCWPVDERYLEFMGLDVIEGRTFSSNIEADEDKFIFNKKAIEEFGWQDSFLGKMIPGFGFEGELIGLVEDLKYASLHEEVQPMAFWLTKTRHNKLSLRISGNNVAETIAYIQSVYDKFESKYSMDYSFLDERLDRLYKAEEKQAQLILIFCLVSILISIVGALGLIIFMCEYRVKEIGIRKVNGAKVGEIVSLLNLSFIKWIVISFIIAAPLSYYFMSIWLEGFAYRVELNWWVFLLAGIIALLISMVTVSWQSFKAARKNPVEALRYE